MKILTTIDPDTFLHVGKYGQYTYKYSDEAAMDLDDKNLDIERLLITAIENLNLGIIKFVIDFDKDIDNNVVSVTFCAITVSEDNAVSLTFTKEER